MLEFATCVSQLESNKAVMEKLFGDLDSEQARWKPGEDRWSALEILNHLIDIEIHDFRYCFDLILFDPAKAWPSFNEIEWISSKKYNERDLGTSKNNFLEDRAKSINWLKGLVDPDLDSKHLGHGLKNKNMRAGDLLTAWIGHDLFHIKQTTLLKWDILRKWSVPYSPDYSGFYV